MIVATADDDVRLSWCLRALAAQVRAPRFEVLVINDGGGPDSEALVRSCRRELDVKYHYLHPRTELFRLSAARNLGAKWSTGSQLVFIDQDIVVDPDYLWSMNKFYDPSHGLYGLRRELGEHLVGPRVDAPSREWLLEHAWVHDYLSDQFAAGKCPGPTGFSMAVDAEKFCEIGGFDEAFVGWGYEDIDLVRRLAKVDYPMHIMLDRAWCTHLGHPRREVRDADFYDRNNYMVRMGDVVIRNGGPLIRPNVISRPKDAVDRPQGGPV